MHLLQSVALQKPNERCKKVKKAYLNVPNASGILIVFPNPSNDNIITIFMFDNIPRCKSFLYRSVVVGCRQIF